MDFFLPLAQPGKSKCLFIPKQFTNPEIVGRERYARLEKLLLWGDTFILSRGLESGKGSKQPLITLIIINMNTLSAVTQELSAAGRWSISSMKAEMILFFAAIVSSA